jgi:hypothetical protein
VVYNWLVLIYCLFLKIGIICEYLSLVGKFSIDIDLFLNHINDLPKLASIGTKILLYADYTSIIVTSPNWKLLKNKLTKYFRISIIGSK